MHYIPAMPWLAHHRVSTPTNHTSPSRRHGSSSIVHRIRSLQRSHRRVGYVLAVLVTGLIALLMPASTWAHPLGNFTINRYSRLEVGSAQLQLYYVIDMAEIPTFQERNRIDTNDDDVMSAAEQEQYLVGQMGLLQRNLQLQVGGRPLTLQLQERELEFPVGQGGLPILRLTARFAAELPPGSASQAEYRDTNYADRLGWQEIVVRSEAGTEVLDSTVPAQDVSDELRSYPADLLQSPLAVNSASFRFQPGGTTTTPATTASVPVSQPVEGRGIDQFAALITTEELGPLTLLFTLLVAFGLGAVHALSPGHGKTIVAAYLVGSRGTMRHALFLGLTTTITHTAGVFALGLVTLLVSEFILPEQLYPWLGAASGLIVCGIGLTLFRERLRTFWQLVKVQNERRTDHHHHHHHQHVHHHDHAHEHAHTHDHHHHGHHHHHPDDAHDHHHAHQHDHDHHHDHPSVTHHASLVSRLRSLLGHGHSHSHMPPGADGSPITWRSLLALGISGGLLPCPSALVVLLSAIALHRVGLGLLLIVAFSLGLASVLTAIGIVMVHAGRWFERIPTSGRLMRAVPVVSALAVTLAGIAITVQALGQI